MKDITLIGAGLSARAFIDALGDRAKHGKITVIDQHDYAVDRGALIDAPADMRKRLGLKEWTEDKRVTFINVKVERVNTKRKKIYCKDAQVQDYQHLIVASGLQSKKLSIKGEHREGVFYISDMDPLLLRDSLRLYNEIIVQAATFLGIKLALVLQALGKEVRILLPDSGFLGTYKERVLATLSAKSIPCYLESFIEEAVGEGIVRATKISPLKVFSSQLIFVDSGFVPVVNFFEEDLQIRNTFFTNFEDVYCIGDVSDTMIGQERYFIHNRDNAIKAAKIFASFCADGLEAVFEKKTHNEDDIERVYAAVLEGCQEKAASAEVSCDEIPGSQLENIAGQDLSMQAEHGKDLPDVSEV